MRLTHLAVAIAEHRGRRAGRRIDLRSADTAVITIGVKLDGSAAPLVANLPPDALLSTSAPVERARSTPTHGRYRISGGTAATLTIRLPLYKRLLVDVAGKRHAHTPTISS